MQQNKLFFDSCVNLCIFLIALTILITPAHAYVNAIGGGLIFQLGYIIFIGCLTFVFLPFKNLFKFFKKKKEIENASNKDSN